jgi:ATP-dependent Zn protease
MKTQIPITLVLLLSSSAAGLAQSSSNSNSSESLQSALYGFLPIAIFLVVLFFMFRRQTKPLIDFRQKKVERQIQHMQRVEELLERIAVALERK